MAKSKRPRRVDVFYAFPSQPPDVEESISQAADSLKTHPLIKEANVRFKLWPDMNVSGRRMIKQVTENIDRADVFACDLTFPNLNVAFELGYAIGRFKRVWISVDTTQQLASQEYQRLYGGLFTVGYASYSNHKDLAQALLTEHPWTSLEEHLLHEAYRKRAPRPEQRALLYLRPQIETNAVIDTTEMLSLSAFKDGLLVDDPNDNPSQSLEWYAEKTHRADAVLVHLLSPKQRGSDRHNVKASFVAGLAHAFGKPLKLLAHVPFENPIDYQELLEQHKTAKACRQILGQWLEELGEALPRRRPRLIQEQSKPKSLDVRNLAVGEPVAEHEFDTLDYYFVETVSYYEALRSQTAILVGRRGTGKTAILFALETAFSLDKRNHVCVIKPPGYEIDGLVELLEENLKVSERGYLIESLWKFLIYSELVCSVADEISIRPVHLERSSQEEELLDYVERRANVLRIPFSERLDTAVRSMTGVGELEGPREQRLRISESLHVSELHDLRRLLGSVLGERQKVAVLIDNLDKPWHPGHDIHHQANLLSGLLQVATDITDDFRREKRDGKRVILSLIVFLRSDIFAHVQPLLPEQDKLPLQWILWNDRDVLLRVLELRLAHSLPQGFDAEDVWGKLLPTEVVGLPTRDFIVMNALARPRDVIYLLKQAIAVAVNRGHAAVTEEDFLEARREYSEFAFRSLLAEDDPDRGHLEAVLYEFAGVPGELANSKIRDLITGAGVGEEDVDFYIDLLCDVNFLGIETTEGFRYSTHEGDRQMLREMATRVAAGNGVEQSFKINAAFHQVLQID